MNINHLQTYSQQKNIYDIHRGLEVTVDVDENPYGLPLEVLFSMAARKNPKRRFLFVSKILGKHIPVNPYLPLLGGAALAVRYLKVVYNVEIEQEKNIIHAIVDQKSLKQVYRALKEHPLQLPQKVLFIGFAETATALGHSMFDCFSDNGTYIHTTRESIIDLRTILSFEEEHSHATSHHLYAEQIELLKSQDQVVLIDDEITTGKTALNIIEALQRISPRKQYVVLSLLDWRSEEDKINFREMELRLGIEIISVSLLSGTISINESAGYDELETEELCCKGPLLTPEIISEVHYLDLSDFYKTTLKVSSINSLGEVNRCAYLKATGRFGITSAENSCYRNIIEKIGQDFFKFDEVSKILCLGTGEFMFLPMSIATYIGSNVCIQSTTRSPIHAIDKDSYGVRNSFSFESPDEPSLMNYLYNIPINYYDKLYLFVERDLEQKRLSPIIDVIKKFGVPQVFVVKFCKS